MKSPIGALLMSLIPVSAFAHGEDKPGPHGGFIRMPGAYHTELVVAKPNAVKVYLLDINWKNPTTTKSQVAVKLKAAAEHLANCSPQKEFFLCTFDKQVDVAQPGKLLVSSKRGDVTGADMTYDLPLRPLKPSHGH